MLEQYGYDTYIDSLHKEKKREGMKVKFTELFNQYNIGFGFRAASGAIAGSFTFYHSDTFK